MIKRQVLLTGLVLCSVAANAQAYKDGYVKWGIDSREFAWAVGEWKNNNRVNSDDNFFISRVKPRATFRNAATQVRAELNETNDKKLIAWVPINEGECNALPNGVFDSEVFSMWPYVTHWGNWTAPIGRIPGAFLDVAHKNGVGVSSVASVPFGGISMDWSTALSQYGSLDPKDVADFMRYYGCDGLGYNSEFSGLPRGDLRALRDLHAGVVAEARKTNPLFTNFWYDGTNDNGGISFDRGLSDHNDETFGDGQNERTSLFFNYNWNSERLLSSSVAKAEEMGRSSLDLYAGCNMQGNEPAYNNWPLLKNYPISIGLWGAHSKNMWWESRNEKGSAADVQQRSYMLRTERWFTGGNRNPAICPGVISSMTYVVDNFKFHGMSSFMTARSALKWNLAEEPFITYFNLGNGKYFNWKGEKMHNKEWYNIGVQDYLPTWRWWFTSKLLSGNVADVPETGLDAEFTWDYAYVGGSCLRIFGSHDNEYLHLFKTEYTLNEGDVITVRYKLNKGTANMKLVLTAKGDEKTPINENDFVLMGATQEADEDLWVEKSYKVTGALAGKDLALIALHFEGAKDLDLNLGEFSIVRGTTATPAKPELNTPEILAYNKAGVDAKLTFNMANDKAAGEPCYNVDVNTSLFKLYSQQEGEQPKFEGLTTSWGALYYGATMNPNAASSNIRFGVSAVSLDMKSESEIAWTDYVSAGAYTYNDDVQLSQGVIKPNESFEMSYVDPKHEAGKWELIDGNGNVVYTGEGHTVTVEGLKEIGSYTLKVTGMAYDKNSDSRQEVVREFGGFVQITSEGVGSLPKILTLTANNQEADLEVKTDEEITLEYTGRKADGAGSQGVDLAEQRFGAKCEDLGLVGAKSFSVGCWLKINSLAPGETQLLAVADKTDNWPKTDWGWLWTNINEKGEATSFTVRGSDYSGNNELQYTFGNTKLPIGSWFHIAYVFDYNGSGDLSFDLYINGVKQDVVSWKRSQGGGGEGHPGHQGGVYNITSGMVLSMGGNAFGRAGINGAIDNFVVWNKAITAEEVKTSMGDLDPNNLPAGVAAFWDLEEKAGADFCFKSVGSLPSLEAGLHSYDKIGGEGQGKFHWVESDYTSGCPFIAGTAFPVVTAPTWKAKKATIASSEGNDQAGNIKLSYANAGDYTVTLTLANSLGKDVRTFQVIKVAGIVDGIEDASKAETKAYVVGDKVFVDFAEAGNYNVRVYNVAGQMVAQKAQFIQANQKMELTLGQVGTYVLDVQKDGKSVRTAKLIRK